jgi:uncharacterized protein (TIGR02646 family)
MRYIKKPKNPPDELLSNEVVNSLLEIIKDKSHKKVNSSLYQGENDKGEKTVVKALLLLYHEKCAYCERYIGLTSIEIEHYRPKSKYYWLCYEWTNLLPSCHECNKIGSGKGIKFPLMTTLKPTIPTKKKDFKAGSKYLKDQKPYLLHPEIDKPESFFRFDNKGEMFGTDKEERGKKTIEICNLNRAELKKDRQEKAIDTFFSAIKIVLASYDEGLLDLNGVIHQFINIFDKFKESQSIKYSFSLMRIYVFKNFETIIVPLFTSVQQRQILVNAYQLYNNGNL